MPEFLRVLPQWALILGLFGAVAIVVFVLSALVLLTGSALRRPVSADGPTLAESAEPMLRARRGRGKFDARFERMAEGTQLGIDGETAIGWILLVGAILAATCYMLTVQYLSFIDGVFLTGCVFLVGGLGVFLFFWTLKNRRRRAIQEQLPDGCFQLARSLRSGLALPAALIV